MKSKTKRSEIVGRDTDGSRLFAKQYGATIAPTIADGT